MSSGSSILRFWWTDLTRDGFLACVPKEDILSLRLVCHDFSVRTAPILFENIDVEFRSSTFTRPARMAALERIGVYVKTLTFKIAHSEETFLPPLLDPVTGEEQTFVYSPQLYPYHAAGSRMSIPKYGTWEMTELLTKQYPPLFHAATNIPSFVRALAAMPSLTHLKICCEGQVPGYRYRRSVVDYALISLRVAIEQAPLKALDKLSLLPIHPGALLYLRPHMGFGTSPSAHKRWLQIRKLSILMDSFPYESGRPTDHLKLIHSYLQSFPSLTRFSFRWNGAKGPCPLSLSTEPCMVPSPRDNLLRACPKRSASSLKPIKFRSLQYMELENAVLDASQVSSFILEHRHTVREFNFEDVVLRSGTWDEALMPLTRISGNDQWKQKQEEIIEVPIMLSPVGMDKGQVRKAMLEEEKRKDTRLKNFRAYTSLHRASLKTRGLFRGSPDHVKRLLRSSVFTWR